MADQDYYAFPTGGSGLTPAVIPKGESLIDSHLLMSAIQQRLLNKHRAEQLDLDLQKMSQFERLKEQDLALEKQRLDNAYEVQKSQISLNQAHEDYYKNYAVPARKAAAEQAIEYNKQVTGLKFEANQRLQELGLNDPNLQAKNPIQFAANVRKFEDEYGTAPTTTGISNQITAMKRVVDQLKIPVNLGAQYDEGGELVNKGTSVPYPVYQVVEKLQDPQWHDYMMNALKAAGHMKTIPGATHTEGGFTVPSSIPYVGGKRIGGKEVKEKPTTELDDLTARYLREGGNVDFSRSRSRVPAMIAPSAAAYKGTAEQRAQFQQQLEGTDQGAALPEQDQSNLYPAAAPASTATPYPQPTETDQILSQAQRALQAGAPVQAIVQRLQAHQIDPNLLFQNQQRPLNLSPGPPTPDMYA